MADRGYESYNVLAHIQEKGRNCLIRIKDSTSKGMTSIFRLPKGEFDTNVYGELTRKQTKEGKTPPELYKFLPSNSNFDYLELVENDFYPMNLDADKFAPEELKRLYYMR